MALSMLLFIFSCDNTTADPISYNTGSSGSSATITGPRILHKVLKGTDVTEEYVTTGGKISKSIIKDVPNNITTTTDVTYVGNQISKLNLVSSNGATILMTLGYSNGVVTSAHSDHGISTMPEHSKSDYSLTYTSGKLTKIIIKKDLSVNTPGYTHYEEINIIYNGNNATKAELTNMFYDSVTNNPDPSSATTTAYLFSDYDTKINPYSTLPKEYLISRILLSSAGGMYYLSANNVRKMDFQVAGITNPLISGLTYVYDSENYPISDQAQTGSFVYKPL